QVSDLAVTLLSHVIPTPYSCDNPACYRQSATFGDIVLHSRINAPTHAMMGELVPECVSGFLKDVAIWGRRDSVLTEEDRTHLDRLALPMHLISGSENRMFVPEATKLTYELLCEANGPSYYKRTVHEGFGHLDCYFGEEASGAVWPDIAAALA